MKLGPESHALAVSFIAHALADERGRPPDPSDRRDATVALDAFLQWWNDIPAFLDILSAPGAAATAPGADATSPLQSEAR